MMIYLQYNKIKKENYDKILFTNFYNIISQYCTYSLLYLRPNRVTTGLSEPIVVVSRGLPV